MTNPPSLTVLSGPTAVGKGTVVRALASRYPDLAISVSATTRPPRPGEVDGEDYYFVSERDFDQLIETGQLLEWATVHGRYRYGTPRGPIEEALAGGQSVLLEIDLAGARQVRETMPEAKFVFLMPPSREELGRRLVGRGTEDEEEQQRRLETAEREMAAAGEFDAIVINDKVESAVRQLAELMGLN